MTKTARYQIIVKNGRKIIECHQMMDYRMAMDLLDLIYAKFSTRYKIEFKEHGFDG